MLIQLTFMERDNVLKNLGIKITIWGISAIGSEELKFPSWFIPQGWGVFFELSKNILPFLETLLKHNRNLIKWQYQPSLIEHILHAKHLTCFSYSISPHTSLASFIYHVPFICCLTTPWSFTYRSCYLQFKEPEEIGVYVCVSAAQSCPTLCDLMDYNPPGSSVHGISQARILEWVVIFRGSSWPRDRTHVSHWKQIFFFLTIWATREAQRG